MLHIKVSQEVRRKDKLLIDWIYWLCKWSHCHWREES